MKVVNNLALLALLLGLGGCVTAPSPFGGAPVEDRSLSRVPPEPRLPPVEVQPLERDQPITPRDYTQSTPPPSGPMPAVEPAPAPAAPTPEPTLEPQQSAQVSTEGNPAVVALLDSAAGYVGSGELDKAAAALERALRIEPRNAGIWYDLAQIRLHQRQYQQAESMASRSNGLTNDAAQRARNWRLIAAARRAAGDTAGADEAQAQAVVAERGR